MADARVGASRFVSLLEPLRIGGVTLANRIVSTGHDTVMAHDGRVTDQLVEYQRARAGGGAGLIVLQAAGIHPTAKYTSHVLMADDDDAIAGFGRLAAAIHNFDVPVFAQLFHAGREIMEGSDGSLPVAYGPSAVPNERFHVMPRSMPTSLVHEVIDSYASSAARMFAAGLDGVEVVASHGYLPSQFMEAETNSRNDEFGGDRQGRLTFLRSTLERIRLRVPAGFVVGVRVSLTGADDETLVSLRELDDANLIDYVSVVAGTSATHAGSDHIAPPMTQHPGYTAPLGAAAKSAVRVPVIVTGRINDPGLAESVIAAGQADAVGMTRAMICDPELGNKVRAGTPDHVRACIGCNQACIGHFQLGYPISCIQHPASGREREAAGHGPAGQRKSVVVIGGGPAGLKCAVTAAQRGHRVRLFEAKPRLGGQVLLAEQLPGRSEFGGVVTNLAGEAERAGVEITLGYWVSSADVLSMAADEIVIATGALPREPRLEIDGAQVLSAWEVIRGERPNAGRVVVADWRSDWVGLGVATMLGRMGRRVTLAVTHYFAGAAVQQYVRDELLALALDAGVEVVPLVRPFGADADSVYLQHVLTGEPVVVDDVGALVLAQGHVSNDELLIELGSRSNVHGIGDALSPRTVEEAILEGWRIGAAI